MILAAGVRPLCRASPEGRSCSQRAIAMLPGVAFDPTVSPRPPRWRGRCRRLILGASASWHGYLLIAAGWVAVLAGAFGLLARSREWGWQPLIIAAGFFEYLTTAAVLGGALLAARRAWAGPAVAALLAILAMVVLVPCYVADNHGPPGGPTLTVLQANLGVGAADPGKLVAQIDAQHADVLTVDELTPAELGRLTASGLSHRLPYHLTAPYPGGAGTGIWSRYPLTATGRDDRFSFELLTARIRPPGAATTELIAVHLLPPWPYPAGTWLHEMHRLHRLLTAQPATLPVIVSGDFNATLDHPQFRSLLAGGYHDAADQAGAGLLPTYPTDRIIPPLLALDHVLVRTATATAVRTLALPGSDHRALLARLALPMQAA